ncbi:MAG: mce8C [Nocardia sp.]|uniref:MlaD family protein n=1 Tax=Nocardia sp. TaxID=1821 RepID=UPI00260E1485|nr:MlaD family protein [Nocardia sp.]MCU1639971.1 mce8C [Nocardia sp.]
MQQLRNRAKAAIRTRVAGKRWQPAIFRAGRRGRTAAADERRQLRLGIVGAGLLAFVLLAAGVIYVLPLDRVTYSADLTEAQSLTTGDEVRVAGIAVGKVTGLQLRPGRVRMTFTVRKNVFIGDQSTLDIRMLTVVGGHYVALVPAGSNMLGSKVIPADRVHLPYSLMQSMQDAAKPVAEVNGDTLRQNVLEMQAALSRSPDALRDMGRAVQSLVTVLDKQNADVSQALAVSDEFLTAIDNTKSLIGTFVRKLGVIEVQTLNKKAEIAESLRVTGELMARLEAIEPTWYQVIEPVLHQLTLATPQMQQLLGKFDQAVATVQDIRNRLQAAVSAKDGVTVDQSGVTIIAPAVCVPVPGRGC